MNIIDVVCGISINKRGVFLARLNMSKGNAGFWEFPGGKVCGSETHEEALAREFLEELNVVVNVKNYFMSSEIVLDNEKIILYSYFIDFDLEPEFSTDHDLLARFNKNEISKLKLSKADIPFVEKILNDKLI